MVIGFPVRLSRGISAALASAFCLVSFTACTEGGSTSTTSSPGAVGTSTSTGVIPTGDAPSDPLLDIKADRDVFGDTYKNNPLVHQKGVGPESIRIDPVPQSGDYYVLINCAPASQFHIDDTMYGGECRPEGGSYAIFPASSIKSVMKVGIPQGTRYEIVVIEKELPA